MKRRSWGCLAIALALGASGCGAAAPAAAPQYAQAGMAPPPPPPAPGVASSGGKSPDPAWASVLAKTGGAAGGQAATTAPHESAMLIYVAHLTLSVFEVQKDLDRVEELARSVGGYLSARTDTQATIRVPRARFQDALQAIEKVGEVLHRDVTAQDVTDEYADLDVRLKNSRAMRDRLQQLLQNASVKDALEIEKELGRVTQEIERMEGRLKLLGDQIAYSTISVTFQPVDQNPVRDLARLPFPWLRDLGLTQLLNVREATP
jgi:hypothetical protein